MKTFFARLLLGLALATSFGDQPVYSQEATALSDRVEEKPAPIILPSYPTVSLSADPWKTAEPCPTCLVVAATLQLQRTGPTNRSLVVRLKGDGTATAGADYQALPERVEIPAGVSRVSINLLPLDDRLVEGPEIVRASISALAVEVEPTTDAAHSSDLAAYYVIGANSAMMVIGDDEAGAPEARLDITTPTNGANFQFGHAIEISALGVWTRGEITQGVEFYDGDKLIGRSSPPATLRPAIIPGWPSAHSVRWTNPPAGKHVLTARTALSADLKVASPPVEIVVLAEPVRTVVRIEATRTIAEETSGLLDRIPLTGEFTISRTGPTNEPLSVFVQYSGMATAEADYVALPFRITIPAGAVAERIQVVAKADHLLEGIETLVAKVSNCPPLTDPPMGIPCMAFEIEPAHAMATVFIRDDATTTASVMITRPKDGAQYEAVKVIPIEAVAIDLNGYINRLEFWDGEQRIGVSEITFIRAPDPGTPINHSFEWREPAAGSHSLTARGATAAGMKVVSPAVSITVAPAPNPVVLEIITSDALATEVGPDNVPDPAVFLIKRVSGPRDVEVPVFYSMSGSASNGVDYAELNGMVTLPSGAEAVRLVVTPRPDNLLEGEESVIATLQSPKCIAIYPSPPQCYQIGGSSSARAVIHDGGTNQNQAPRVAIARPVAGTEFPADASIEIVAEARDTDGYVASVGFFADDRKIGEANVTFIRKPTPGESQKFVFVWHNPTPGSHMLTVSAKDDGGLSSMSDKVEIFVKGAEEKPVLMVHARDAYAVEPGPDGETNTATFVIRRFGSTNEPLVVVYALQGTAENGIDYERLSGQVTIPAGRHTTTVEVRPLADDLAERIETVVLRLDVPMLTSASSMLERPYNLGLPPQRAAIVIRDHVEERTLAARSLLEVTAAGEMSLTALPEGLLHLRLDARGETQLRVEASNDLENWETVSIEAATDGYVNLVEDTSLSTRKFYRLIPDEEPLPED